MAKITQVTIINANTLRLDVDAKQGDEINLIDIARVDSSFINKMIEENKEIELNKRLNELKKTIELEANSKYSETKSKLEKENIELITKLNSIKSEVESNMKLLYLEEINALKAEIEKTKSELCLLKETNQSKIKELNLQNEINNQQQLNKIKEEYLEEIKNKEREISDLKLQKSAQNIKRIGEELENWCNTEYENYAQCGFATCTWEKDNIAIKNDDESKGTKADYIFKVYSSNKFNDKELLTSVACEMKNESPNSTNKKKNADHYNKLDKDRTKKNCEYALLISELEWDQPNDLPIKKVKEYDKMYVVRPQYFITFLSIVTQMSLKFKELILDELKEQEMFKDANTIKAEFEKFKSDLLDKPLAKLEKELSNMIDNANKIKDYSNKIIDSASQLINKTIKDIETKVNNFKIDRLVNKIEKLEN